MKISDDMLQRAKAVDLVDYLQSLGYTMFCTGGSYKIKVTKRFHGDLSSLSVFSDRKGWKRWSDGSMGNDTISFLQKVMGKSFQDAVCELCHELPHTEPDVLPVAQSKDKQLTLPEVTDGKFSRVFAYLTKTRGIDTAIVTDLMKQKMLYQDKQGNVVFLGMDDAGTYKYAAFRSTLQDKKYRGECSGSDKRYGFRMNGECPTKLYVFEAPIDAMSHASLVNKITGKPDAWKAHTRISLGGTSDVALMQYLSDHPECSDITLCLDNDQAGLDAAKLIAQKLRQQGYTAVRILPPKCKDYNEQLIAYHTQKTETQVMKR